MGLRDLPQIDDSAKYSAASERKVDALLNLDTGFIVRKEIPDKGCDFMVELVIDKDVTGYKFPVQLKSIENIHLVDNDQYISYPVLTSRLGYMLNHTPTTGIFVLYDDQTGKCYYDFSDTIYNRIVEDRPSDDWIDNDKVSIRIPIKNELDVAGIREMKTTMLSRFDLSAKMQVAFGSRYGLPVAHLLNEEFDPRNPAHLKRLLKEHGLVFLSQYDISVLFHALENFTATQISADKDLLMLAASVYCEVGKYLDSDLARQKAQRMYDLSDSEKRMLAFIDLKNNMVLGEITPQQFRERAEQQKGEGEVNNIILDINILRYELVDDVNVSQNQSYKERLKNIYDRIAKSNLSDTTKQLYNLWNAINESVIIGNTFSINITLARTSESLGNSMTLQEKQRRIISYLQEENQFLKRISDIYKAATASKNDLVSANALQISALHLVQHIISTIGLGLPTDGLEEKIRRRVAEAIESYNLFVGLQLNKDAHYSLHLLIELLDAAKALCHSPVDEDLDTFTALTSKMEKELIFEPIPRKIIEHLNETQQKKEEGANQPGMASLKGVSDSYLEHYTHILMESVPLPADRYTHVLDSLKAYRLFHDRCTNPDIIPREAPHDQSYRHPISFVLMNQKTGFISLESTNMDELLSSWGY